MSDWTTNDDRGFSPTVRRQSRLVGFRVIATVVIVVIVAIVAGVVIYREMYPAEPPPKEKLPEMLSAVVSYPQDAPTPVRVVPTPAPQTEAPAPQPITKPQGNPQAQGFFGNMPQIKEDPPPKMHAVFNGTPTATQAASSPASTQQGGTQTAGAEKDHGDIIYATSKVDGIQAGSMGDPTLRLDRGLVPCVLDWRSESTIAGEIQCHIPRDVMPHGVTLLDAGTLVHGTYRADVKTGQARMQMAVDFIEDRKTNCFVKLNNANFADGVGTAGVPASVDNHYAARFLPAIALSFTQGAMGLAQSVLSKGGNTYISLGGGGGGAEQLVNEMFQAQANQPPTVTTNEGTVGAIVINQSVDFSHCYGLELRHAGR